MLDFVRRTKGGWHCAADLSLPLATLFEQRDRLEGAGRLSFCRVFGQHKANRVFKSGAPVGIRTSNLLIRSQMLYPVELRALYIGESAILKDYS